MKIVNSTWVRYLISNPRVNSYKRKLQQKDADVKIFRRLSTTTTSAEALTLRSNNQQVVDKAPWLKVAFWSRLAELYYLESEA